MFVNIESKLINNLSLKINNTDGEKLIILSEGDIINVEYIEGDKLKTILGKLIKINKDRISVDASEPFSSKVEFIDTINIRDVVVQK